MRLFFAWFLLLLLGLGLILMGIQGSAGRVVAVAFTPASLDVQE